MHLFVPKETYRYAGGGGFGGGRSGPAGQNPPNGVVVYYSLAAKPAGELTIEFFDPAGKLVKKFSSVVDPKAAAAAAAARPTDDDEEEGPRGPQGPVKLPAEVGMNRFVWDLRYPDSTASRA